MKQQQKIKLTTGLKTNKELAEWFGIIPNSFCRSKDKKLKELHLFAEYHLEKDKVFIDEVLIPIYSKQGSRNYQKVKEALPKYWSATGLDTCTNVSHKIYIKEIKYSESLSESTTYRYTTRARNDLFGRPLVARGELGECHYILCKKLPSGECDFFTPEEDKIKKEMLKKYFSTADEMTVMVNEMVSRGEITSEEAWRTYAEMIDMQNNYPAFLTELTAAIGYQVVKGTVIEYTQEF